MRFEDLVRRFMPPPRPEVVQDMAWLQRIPKGAPPPGRSSLFGTHVAVNKAECPFSYLADRALPDTVRFDHGIMAGSTPDAVYTRDPGLARQLLQDKTHPKVRRWYWFHMRFYGYGLPRDVITFKDNNDPMVARLRKAYLTGLSDILDRHGPAIEGHIDRWVNTVARGDVEIVSAIRRLVADISHLTAFGQLPADPFFPLIYKYLDGSLLDSKRHIARLLWPTLDRLPTPYGLIHRTRSVAARWVTRYYYRKYRTNEASFVGQMHRQGLLEKDPDFALRLSPFFVNAVNAIFPHPMMMALVELAGTPALQQRIVDEDLYAETFKETMRLHSPVTTIGRVSRTHLESESAVLEPMASEEGHVYINGRAIHRDPRGWSRPNEFLIDRWLSEWDDGSEAERRLYIPFGLGARSCVAASFASKLIEMFLRVVLSQRIVTNPSGRQPRLAEGSHAILRRPFTLHFADRPRPQAPA